MIAGSGQLTPEPVPVLSFNGLVYVRGCEEAGKRLLTLCAVAGDAAKAAIGSNKGKISDLEGGNTEDLRVVFFSSAPTM
jgi:hypothetical protein